METAENKPKENAMIKHEREEAKRFVRKCPGCGRQTEDEHETICIKCGASTREV